MSLLPVIIGQKRTIVTSVLLLTGLFFTSSCQDNASEEHFMATYKGILLLRTKHSDTAVCNPKVREYLQQQGYSEASFGVEFLERSQDGKTFLMRIDSLRSKIRSEGEAPSTRKSNDNIR